MERGGGFSGSGARLGAGQSSSGRGREKEELCYGGAERGKIPLNELPSAPPPTPGTSLAAVGATKGQSHSGCVVRHQELDELPTIHPSWSVLRDLGEKGGGS